MKIGKNKIFIIAELSDNHNGSVEFAIETIRPAKKAGVDCVKLQTYTADTMIIECNQSNVQKGNYKTVEEEIEAAVLVLEALEFKKTVTLLQTKKQE